MSIATDFIWIRIFFFILRIRTHTSASYGTVPTRHKTTFTGDQIVRRSIKKWNSSTLHGVLLNVPARTEDCPLVEG